MTQSAVSHQVKTLEDLLGQPLFNRRFRGAVPTDAGVDLLQTVRDCLGRLDHGLRRLEQYKKPNQIIVSAPRAFADAVVVPNLPDYGARHPDHNIWLYTEDALIDPLLGEVYVTFLRADQTHEGVEATPVCRDRLTPMASPAVLERLNIRTPHDLAVATLLFDERREDWQTLFHAAGVPGSDQVEGYNFSDSRLLLQAATSGIGIALGSLTLGWDMLQDERLVAPFPDLFIEAPGYVMVSRPDALTPDRVRNFRTWILDLMATRGLAP